MVFECWVCHSITEDPPLQFQSRKDFKDTYGCFPNETKPALLQVRATNFGHHAEVGVIRIPEQRELGLAKAAPVGASSSSSNGCQALGTPHAADGNLETNFSRTIVWRRPVLTKEKHLFADQAQWTFDQMAKQGMQYFGQETGNKYDTKMKAVPSYSEADVQDSVRGWERAQATKQGTSSFAATLQRAASRSFDDVGQNDGGGEAVVGSPPPPQRVPSALCDGIFGASPASATDQGSMCSPEAVNRAKWKSLSTRQANGTDIASQVEGDSASELGADTDGDDLLGSRAASEKGSDRVMKPMHWVMKLSCAYVFQNSVTKDLQYARACIARNVAQNPLEAMLHWDVVWVALCVRVCQCAFLDK